MATGYSADTSDTESSAGVTRRTCKVPGCGRERFAHDGEILDFCGRMHAYEYSRLHNHLPPIPQHLAKCKLPGCDRVVFFEADTGRIHDFCCKTHANDAIARGLEPPPNRLLQGEPDEALRCCLYGCTARRHSDPEMGRMYDFCGWTHALKGLKEGQQAPPTAELSAHSSTPIPTEAFIRTFRGRPREQEYSISMMTNRHPKYKAIKEQFHAGWDVGAGHGGPPVVVRVWQVRNPSQVWEQYRQYEEEVGHKTRRFHGTSMKCTFGVNINKRPCDDLDCSVCSICESGFKLDRAHSGPMTRGYATLRGSLRYDVGLYFSKHSSKSHDYASNSEQPLHVKAAASSDTTGPKLVRCMFLCRVALGRELRTDQATLGEVEVCIAATTAPVLRCACAQPTREARPSTGSSHQVLSSWFISSHSAQVEKINKY